MTTHAQVRHIGRKWVLTCITCPALYGSYNTEPEARVKQVKHDRRHGKSE